MSTLNDHPYIQLARELLEELRAPGATDNAVYNFGRAEMALKLLLEQIEREAGS